MRGRLSKPWRVAKWMAVIMCAALVLVWMPSRCSIRYIEHSPSLFHPNGIYSGYWLGNGGAGYIGYLSYKPPVGFSWGKSLCGRNEEIGTSHGFFGVRVWFFPAWIPLVIVESLTLLLFYLDRRLPKGHCRNCGYDLTGNVSGTCPECGKSI